MKITLDLQGRTLRDLAADFLRQGLGMPIIRGRADAPAQRMSAEALIALEQALQTQE